MTPTVLLIRHGQTEMNDPANEKVRGYTDVPISFEGKQGVEHTRDFLKERFHITHILASPLQRAMMTAQLIAMPFNAPVQPCHYLLPWNLGEITGQPVTEMAPRMNYLQEFPEIKVPGGESYKDFYDRWSEGLDRMLMYAEQNPDKLVAGVVHSRNLLALPSILGSRNIGDVPVKGGPGPESVTEITQGDSGEWTMKKIHEEVHG